MLPTIRAFGSLEYRVQNGFIALPGEFPSVVLLTGKVNRCTGTLIAMNKVLTAGHCACGDTMTDVSDADDVFTLSLVVPNITIKHRCICYPLA